jgi:Zn-dependent protease with chaperone function
VRELAGDLGVRPPGVEVLVSEHHALHCRGWLRPRVVMSTGTLGALSDQALRAALAHELAHVAHHDVLRNWILLLLRALQWFNPVAQAIGRRVAQELEWRADDRAASTTGAPLALAQALVRCARHRGDRFLGLSGHGRLRHLEERCRRLLRGSPPSEEPVRLEIALVSTGLAALLLFVQ